MSRPDPGQAVLIHWVDISTEHGWTDPGTELELEHCRTIGFVTNVNDRAVSIAACVGAEPEAATQDDVNLRMTIPWGCVTSWLPLVFGKPIIL